MIVTIVSVFHCNPLTVMSCLAPSSPQFSLWKWSRKWRSASRGITRDLDVSTPAELQKMDAAAIASSTFEQQSATYRVAHLVASLG